MIQNRYIHYLLPLAAVLLASCGNDAIQTEDLQPQLYVTTQLENSTTRTTSTALQPTALDHSVQAGIYAYVTGQTAKSAATYGNRDGYGYDNVTYAYNTTASAWQHPAMWLPKDRSSAVDVFVYAPYVSSSPLLTSMPFTVRADQSSENGYLNSDFVFGNRKNIAQTGQSVTTNVKLYHALSKIILSVRDKSGETSTLTRLSKAELGTGLYPVYIDAYVNLTANISSNADLVTTGAVTTGGTTGVITMLNRNPDTDATERYYEFAAILPPQNLPSSGNNLTLTFNMDGIDVTYEGTLPGTLVPGYAYSYQVTIDQKELTVSSARIIPWAEGTGAASTITD